ncbi:MAG TPA: hypothetical protein H9903_14490 [Candidatus Aquabacterium excrementipullorum]|nr:hypothetical protein [Candidatus Aquabacterium excrementipullorum]
MKFTSPTIPIPNGAKSRHDRVSFGFLERDLSAEETLKKRGSAEKGTEFGNAAKGPACAAAAAKTSTCAQKAKSPDVAP